MWSIKIVLSHGGGHVPTLATGAEQRKQSEMDTEQGADCFLWKLGAGKTI